MPFLLAILAVLLLALVLILGGMLRHFVAMSRRGRSAAGVVFKKSDVEDLLFAGDATSARTAAGAWLRAQPKTLPPTFFWQRRISSLANWSKPSASSMSLSLSLRNRSLRRNPIERESKDRWQQANPGRSNSACRLSIRGRRPGRRPTTSIGSSTGGNVSISRNARRSGYLFIAAGCVFLLAAYLGKQVAFCGIALAFIAIGASYVARAKRA